MTRRLSAIAVLLAVLLCAACAAPTDAPAARALTTEEAQLLAVARFTNFDRGSRPFAVDVDDAQGVLHLRGWVDYRSGVGYAAATGDGAGAQSVLWTGDTIGFLPSTPDAQGDPPLPLPALTEQWQTSELDPSAYPLDAVAAALGGLGSDRPDNPLLVQQTGALWLGTVDEDGTALTLFATPPSDQVPEASAPPITAETSPLRLGLDERGLIRLVQIRFEGRWITVHLADAAGPELTLPSA